MKRAVRSLSEAFPALFVALLALYALWPWLPLPGRAAPPRTLVVYGFSTLGEVMNEAIFPAFQRAWAAETGERVEFVSAFAGSGTVTNQLIMGVPAELAILSLELDAWRLAEAGVIEAESWRALPHEGVVNRTPFVILVRPDNPLAIDGFEALTRPGVRIVHPDPLTSGGANWAILAEYGAGAGPPPGDPAAGEALLAGLWGNVVAQAPSARGARTQFNNGFGDALITYEQEALRDRALGRLAAEIVYPRRTVLSEHLLVRIERNIAPDERALVDAFVDFLWSPEGQRLFGEFGFRPVDPTSSVAFEQIADPFTVADYGGWRVVKRDIVDGIWRTRVLEARGQ